LDQLNSFELAGRPMKVNTVTEKNEFFQMNPALLDTDETDRAGIDLGATGRLQLMAKLAEGGHFYTQLQSTVSKTIILLGTGMTIPAAAASALNATSQQPLITAAQAAMAQATAPPIATQCFMLSNMFDPTQ
jgi:RNA-binding protein 23/39